MRLKTRIMWICLWLLISPYMATIKGQEEVVKLKLTGKVTSETGQALSGVEILTNLTARSKTDENGQYTLQVFDNWRIDNFTCCTVTFYLPGYQSTTRAVNLGTHRLDVELKTENMWNPQRCTSSMARDRVGWSMKLLAPNGALIKKEDYGNAHLAIKIGLRTQSDHEWITLFIAPMNVGGIIGKARLLSSTEIQERDMVGQIGRDYRGRDKQERRWRQAGFGNETISYEGVSDETAVNFDKIIDSMCIDRKKMMPPGDLNDIYK